MSLNVQLPPAASMQRTAAVCDQIDAILKDTPGIRNFTVVIGDTTTNTAQYFLTLDDWGKRDPKGLTADAIMLSLNKRLSSENTRRLLDWSPHRADIWDDIAYGSYAGP